MAANEGSDEDRLRRLYDETSRRVYAYARRHGDAQSAEQVLADTFVTAWRHLDHLPDPALPWLLTTARNLVRMHYRATQRRERLHQAAAFEASSSLCAHPGPEDEVVERQAMLEVLTGMSEQDREALLLVAWDGLSHQQAADVLGMSRATFSQRLSRARSRLERDLERQLGPPPQPTPAPQPAPAQQLAPPQHERPAPPATYRPRRTP